MPSRSPQTASNSITAPPCLGWSSRRLCRAVSSSAVGQACLSPCLCTTRTVATAPLRKPKSKARAKSRWQDPAAQSKTKSTHCSTADTFDLQFQITTLLLLCNHRGFGVLGFWGRNFPMPKMAKRLYHNDDVNLCSTHYSV